MSLVTWNPTTKGTDVVLSNGNLTAYGFWQYQSVKTTESKSVGSWYLELKIDTYFKYTGIGIIDDSVATLNNTARTNESYYGLYQNGDNQIAYTHKTTTLGNLTGSLSVNDIVGVLLNMDTGEITFYKNGVFLAKIEGIKTNIVNANIVLTTYSSQDSVIPKITANFGASDFMYTPIDIPSKTKSYDGTQNLASVTKGFVLSDGKYYYLDSTNKWGILLNKPTLQDFLDFGISNFLNVTEDLWEELQDEVEIVYFTDDISVERVFIKSEVHPYSVYDYISENPQAIIYTDSTDDMLVTTTVSPFSVYDYISENPQVIVYTGSTDDITVSTTTEPYDLYDEFGDEVEVLFYTDDEAVTEADLVLEASWSPVDELEGDFEVVTWTDEPQDTAQRVLELTAIPKPQFVKLANPKRLYGYLDDVLAIDASISYRDEVRYLFTDEKETKWYVWDFNSKAFVEVDASTHELILKNGMKHTDIAKLTQDDWRTWTKDYINIGLFLKDNPRDTIVSVVETISYEDYLPRDTVELEKANFYILNTTAKIDIELNGNVLKGFLSDDDLTRVQYRVLLNGGNYYPADGSFTNLGESPQNIELIIGSKDIKIDDWNTIKVEFQDFFGTTDYWATNFMGTYSGLMFKDVYGQYYSSEIGEILQYLDFGVIIAGQTTIEHEVMLKNQYGYDVENVHIYANTSNFPTELECEFSPTQTPFTSHPELKLSGVLKNNEEISFFVRLKTVLGATPDANGSFDIIVRADRVQ